MRRENFLLMVLVLTAMGISTVLAETNSKPQKPRERIFINAQEKYRKKKHRFSKADHASRYRHIEKNAKLGWEKYQEFYQETPDDPDAAWRYSMGAYFQGIRGSGSEKEKEAIYKAGMEAGGRAAKLAPECAPCHFWAAINTALHAETVGLLKTLFSLNAVLAHLEKSIEIDPYYAYSGAYRLMGIIYWKVPGILGGSDDKAKEYFNKAIEYSPEEPLHYRFLAEFLEKEEEDRAAALEVAHRGTQVPPPGEDRLEARDAIKDLKEFIRKHPLPKKAKEPEEED